MIMGLDVTHPSKHDRMGFSIASAVATFDKNFVNYAATSIVQQPRKEIVNLKNITIKFVENFNQKSKAFPEYVLVYRDGVSEGQFNEVIEHEIAMMKEAFKEIDATDVYKRYAKEYAEKNKKKVVSFCPKIVYIIVQKR